ncbi:MAG TPA: metallophosphoesterase family protein [bacterium]|nr:metallophosphoesterase family protein [bacterium]
MKKVFIVGDTHGRLVVPPDDCDIAVHTGDWISEREALRGYGSRTGAPPLARKMDELYDYCLWGNHEWDLSSLLAPGGSRRRLHELHPAEYIVMIEGVTMRFSHYLVARDSARPIPPYPEELLPQVYEEYLGRGWQVVAYGHSHRARNDVVKKVHFVDVGFGHDGDYCVLIVDNGEVRVDLRRV